MKHRFKGKKLNRDINHRKALFKNLISSLILTGELKTTQAKAKAIRRLMDKLITRAKKGTLQARRLTAAFLQNPAAVNKLVDEIAPRFKHRPGGFTTIERLNRRRGDNALIVSLKLIDHQVKPKKSAPKSKSQPKKKASSPRLVPADQKPPATAPVKTKSTAQIQKKGTAK